MSSFTFRRGLLVAAVLAVLPPGALAGSILPTSYTYDAASPWAYWDDTGTQLIDGLYNAVIPNLSLAHPDAYNWVGFENTDALITFNFSSVASINAVTLSMAQWLRAGVYLPTTVTIGGTAFNVDGADYPAQDHVTLTFHGNWTGDDLTVSVARGGQWTFFDEVLFSSPPATAPASVPDHGTTLACLCLAGAALSAGRRIRHRWLPDTPTS